MMMYDHCLFFQGAGQFLVEMLPPGPAAMSPAASVNSFAVNAGPLCMAHAAVAAPSMRA